MHQGQGSASSRRHFIARAAGALAGAGAVAGIASRRADAAAGAVRSVHPDPGPQAAPHRHFKRGLFETARGGKLQVRLKGSSVDLHIEDIQPLGVSAGARSGSNLWHNAFSVRLSGPAGSRVPQGTHPVSIGGKQFDLFVVPVLTRGGSASYQAVINRAYIGRVRG